MTLNRTSRVATFGLVLSLGHGLASEARGHGDCVGRRKLLHRESVVVGAGGVGEASATFETRVGGDVRYVLAIGCRGDRWPARGAARCHPSVTSLTITLNGAVIVPSGQGCSYDRVQVSLHPPGGPANELSVAAAGSPGARVAVTVLALRPRPGGGPRCNTPPLADAGPDQTLPIGATATLDGGASSDADGDALTYAWALESVPPGSQATLSDPAAVRPTIVIDLPGTYRARLVVHDGTAGSLPDTVEISTENSAPVADAGPDQTARLGEPVTLDGSGSTDVDGDPLTYAWTLSAVPSGSLARLDDPTTVRPTFVADRPGRYVAALTVDDGTVTSGADTVEIDTENSAPVADAGPDQTVRVGQAVSLDGTGSSDPDGDPLTYQWAFTTRPDGSGAELAGPTGPRPSFDADLPGAYVVQLVVDDGTLPSAPDTVTIDTTNSAPVADAGPDQSGVPLDTPVSLDGRASSDADGQPLTYSWSLLAKPAGSLAELTGAATSTPAFTPDRVGYYVAQLVVSDGFADSAPDTVTVSPANAPPVADAGPDQTVVPGTRVFLDGSASSDPEGLDLQFAWSLTSRPLGSGATLQNAASAAPTFEADLPGLYLVELVVNDGAQASAPDTVAITAGRPNVSVRASGPGAAEGGPAGAFTLTRTGPLTGPLTVEVLLEGSATNGTDYAPLASNVTFAAGISDVEVSVAPLADTLVEGDEAVVLVLVEGADYDLGAPSQATVTITDAPAPVVTVEATDPEASEDGDGGTYVVRRTGGLASSLNVNLEFTGTATNGLDYAALPGTVTLPAGTPEITVALVPIDDAQFEPREGAALEIRPGGDYLVGTPGLAIVSIVDDDTLVSVVASDPVASENGQDPATFTFQRLGLTTEPLSVFYELSGTAETGVDFVALPGSATFAAGAATVTLDLAPLDDTLTEGPETATLRLLSGPGYGIGALAQATVTIQDDERPGVSVVATDGVAGEAGADVGVFSVSRTGPTTSALTVFYAVAGTASPGVDYESLAGNVVIPAGAASAPVTVTPIDDALVEGAEGVLLVLSPDPAYAVVTPGIAALQIADDDLGVVTVEATDPDASEAGLDPGTFTFRRTGDTTAALVVTVSRGGTAVSGFDYTSLGGSNFVVTIPAGQAATTLTLAPRADNVVEGGETVVLTINPSLAYVLGAPATATVTIADDPAVVTLVASDPEAAEAGLDPGGFVLARTGGDTAAALTVSVAAGGTATAGLDYLSLGGNISIPAGQAAVAVSVTPRSDNRVEGPEVVVLSLGAGTGTTYLVGSPSSAAVTLADDPPVVTALATDPEAAEEGPDAGTVTFTRTGGDLDSVFNVFYTKGGSATNGVDYSGLGGATSLVTIPAGQTSGSVTIAPFDDGQVEGPETVVLTVAPNSSYVVGSPSEATVTIMDND